ncbi:MAG TPA: hypothetical protein VFW83_01390 [Bryobacteraceae bacterium]|nr:hypothetical protein [Bryobacteraceae bacterium]
MKSHNAGRPARGGWRGSPMRIPQVPVEWMDPMSWKLPSGKALAEFALQAGFLAPLMLGTPNFKKRKSASREMPGPVRARMEEEAGEIPEAQGGFSETDFSETGLSETGIRETK